MSGLFDEQHRTATPHTRLSERVRDTGLTVRIVIVFVSAMLAGTFWFLRIFLLHDAQIERLAAQECLATLEEDLPDAVRPAAATDDLDAVRVQLQGALEQIPERHAAIMTFTHASGKRVAVGETRTHRQRAPPWFSSIYPVAVPPLRIPITTDKGAALGILELRLLLTGSIDEGWRLALHTLGELTIGLLGFVLLLAIGVRRMLAPLRDVEAVMDRICKGDLDARVAISGSGDVRRMANNLNRMAASVSDSTRRLAEREDRYRTLLEATPLPVVVHAENRIQYVNAAAMTLLGIDHIDQVADRLFWDFLDEESHKRVQERLTAYIETGVLPPVGEIRVIRVDGEPVDVEIKAMVVELDGRPMIQVAMHDITARKAALQQVERSRRMMRGILDAAPIGIWQLDINGRVEFVNRQFCESMGISETAFLEATDYGVLLPDRVAVACKASDARALASDHIHISEECLTFVDGMEHDVEVRKAAIRDAQSRVVGLVGLCIDITERRRAESRLRLLGGVFEFAREGIMITDAEQCILEVNPSFLEITGYSLDEVIGKTPRLLHSGVHDRHFYRAMWDSIRARGYWDGEVWNRRKNGEIFPEHLSISALPAASGTGTRYIAVFSDISDFKKHQQHIEYLAHYDPLTGLPNRVLFDERIHMAMNAIDGTQSLLAVCYLDLDGFKRFNDLHGHAAGDRLLVELARRLEAEVGPGNTVARTGGDEFILLLRELRDLRHAENRLDHLLAAINQRMDLEGHEATVTASIGVTCYPNDPSDGDTLLRHADQAMYTAKSLGRNRYHFFDVSNDRALEARRSLLAEIDPALSNHEFELHYQPKVDLRDGRMLGVEALVRWRHPRRGLISPGAFLPAIAGTPIDVHLGEWVIDQALGQRTRWLLRGLDIPISVNISPHHLAQESFLARLRSLLAAHPDTARTGLEIEIVESAALHDVERVANLIRSCAGLGVAFALDDFGTGYASLSYLRQLPIRTLKVDQSFVINMLKDPYDQAIVSATIELARSFKQTAVAEGVESDAHIEALLEMGCRVGQGYGIAQPMSAEALELWVENRPPSPTPAISN